MKNDAVSHFSTINTCHSSETPYNAPPSTRNNGLTVTASEGQEADPPEKTSEKDVDSEGG